MEYWVIILYQTYLFAVKLSVTVEQEKWPTWLQPRAFSAKPRHGHAVAPFECTHSPPHVPPFLLTQNPKDIAGYEVSQCICVIGWRRVTVLNLQMAGYIHNPRAKKQTLLFSTKRVFLDLWKWTTNTCTAFKEVTWCHMT